MMSYFYFCKNWIVLFNRWRRWWHFQQRYHSACWNYGQNLGRKAARTKRSCKWKSNIPCIQRWSSHFAINAVSRWTPLRWPRHSNVSQLHRRTRQVKKHVHLLPRSTDDYFSVTQLRYYRLRRVLLKPISYILNSQAITKLPPGIPKCLFSLKQKQSPFQRAIIRWEAV